MSYNKIAKNTSLYTFFSLFSKSINFLLLPLYTNLLTTDEYGIIGLVTALTAFMSTIYTLSLSGSINRFYIELVDRPKVLDTFFSTIFITIIINSIFWTILALIFSDFFLVIMPGIDFYPYVFWGLMTVLLRPIYLVYQVILQSKQEGKKVALLDFFLSIVNILITVLLLVVFRQKAEGVLKAQTLSILLIDMIIIIIFLKKLNWRFNKVLFKKALNYSLPLIPHSLGGMTSTMLDRFVINKYLGVKEAGVYNIAYQFGNLSNIFTMAFNQAFTPWFNEQVKMNNNSQIKIVTKLSILLFSLFAMGVSLFSKEVLELMAKGDFIQGFQYVPFLAFGYAFNGIYFIYSTDLFYEISGKGLRKLAVITIASAVINLISNILLVPIHGVIGAAFAFILTKMIFAIITGIVVKKISRVGVGITNSLCTVLAFFLISMVALLYFSFVIKMMIYIFISSFVLYNPLKTIINSKLSR
ncbi:lipopolysaccharide biosynthesis protein [Flavobacterium adhaerens]|uniref:lipopolysaccharide biosynthesis protein n=1 Tax=Flavobacterium adhaerens TaxID=3149043 RepID=UPI0032B52B2B